MSALELLGMDFVRRALLVALLVGGVCCYLGVFVVLKRIVFVGAALAEVSAMGAAVALFPPVLWAFERLFTAMPPLRPLDHYLPLLLALGFMLLAVAFFSQQRLSRRLPREAIIGATYAAAIGLTLLARSQNPSGESHADEILQGNIITVEQLEVVELAVACALVALVQALFHKEFVLVSFDPEVAQTLGFRSPRWELLWYLTLGVMIAVAIHVAGTVLVFAYLVIPPVTALMLARRLGRALLLSVLLGAAATAGGVLLSVWPTESLPAWLSSWIGKEGVPTSYAIVGFMVLLFALSWLGRTLASALAGSGGRPGSLAGFGAHRLRRGDPPSDRRSDGEVGKRAESAEPSVVIDVPGCSGACQVFRGVRRARRLP